MIADELPKVFPTPVGMNRLNRSQNSATLSVPHARGDEPVVFQGKAYSDECSPRPWG